MCNRAGHLHALRKRVDPATVEGALEIERIATSATPDTGGMGGESDQGWYAHLEIEDGMCLLGGRGVPDSLQPKIWIDKRDLRVAQLRAQNGKRVWFGWRRDSGPIDQLHGLHLIVDTERQLAAVTRLMRAPLAEIAAPVARPSPRVDAVAEELRARRIGGQAALERLQPSDATLLPGLLHAMLQSLQRRHLDEGFAGDHSFYINGYHTVARCSFDVFAVLSQAIQHFLSGPGIDDDDRAAEVRALAVDLRLRALATTTLPRLSQRWAVAALAA